MAFEANRQLGPIANASFDVKQVFRRTNTKLQNVNKEGQVTNNSNAGINGDRFAQMQQELMQAMAELAKKDQRIAETEQKLVEKDKKITEYKTAILESEMKQAEQIAVQAKKQAEQIAIQAKKQAEQMALLKKRLDLDK